VRGMWRRCAYTEKCAHTDTHTSPTATHTHACTRTHTRTHTRARARTHDERGVTHTCWMSLGEMPSANTCGVPSQKSVARSHMNLPHVDDDGQSAQS
jgi:hypothetical protein